MSGLDLGVQCIREVVPEAGAGARVIMEAGYTLLGSLCTALPQDTMDVSNNPFLANQHYADHAHEYVQWHSVTLVCVSSILRECCSA